MTSTSEEGTLLVSGGEDVKYWSVPNIEQVGCKSFGSSINGVCWSPNGLFVAAVLESSGICIIGQKDAYESYTIPTKGEEYCVSVSDNSRYVLTGGRDKVVSIWDLKHKNIKKAFKEHRDTVNAACFNRNFTAIASGDSGGEIFVHNIVTDAADGPFKTDHTHGIRGLQYSYFRKNLLASASDDAAINLWDTNTKQLVKGFSSDHSAPASDLSFSPVNDMLLASVGLDKRLIFYDVVGKKSVKTIYAEGPLSSVEFYNDGATIAAGSSSGKIFVFDLRSGSTPIRVTQAHKTSVRCMAFQRPLKGTDKSSSRKSSDPKSSATKTRESVSSLTNLSVDTKSKPVQRAKATVVVTPQSASRSNGEIFSPLKDDSSVETPSQVTGKGKDSKAPLTKKSPPIEISPLRVAERPDLGRRGISDLSSYTKGLAFRNRERHERLSSGSDTAVVDTPISEPFSPLRTDSGEKSSPSSTQKFKSSPKDISNIDSIFPENRALGRRPSAPEEVITSSMQSSRHSNFLLSDSPKSIVKPELTRKHARDWSANTLSSALEDAGMRLAVVASRAEEPSGGDKSARPLPSKDSVIMQSSPEMELSHEDRLVSRTTNAINRVGPLETVRVAEERPALHPFQVEFIRNMIEDAMEESRTSIHSDLVNLQIEVLRQLQIQQEEIKRVVQQYSINEDLVKENERLREEIRNLKTKY